MRTSVTTYNPAMASVLAPKNDAPELVAAVDLGSNSFHLLVGRVQQTPQGPQIYPLDSLKDVVRLAAGLSADKRLDASSQARAIAALQRFGERLRAFEPQRVRAVATNTFRVAKNGEAFLQTCEAALGFPIEVIAGKEEARLIYNGVAHSIAADGNRRLVIDIGGGSTEFIIGRDYDPLLLESVFVGCIRFSREFFPDAVVSRAAFKQAVLEARRSIEVITTDFKREGWQSAVGSSGSARAIFDVLEGMGETNRLMTLEGLDRIRSQLLKAGAVRADQLPGLKPERAPVFAGGLSIMIAAFEELDIESMQFSDGALRLGVLYDVLGRSGQEDMRALTVAQFKQRYQVDAGQAARVRGLAQALWTQVASGSQEERDAIMRLLGWSAELLEIGHSISHSSFHKHSAYIVSQADMPGFSRDEQRLMSAWILGHVGKLAKVQSTVPDQMSWAALLCLRLAAIFFRSRSDRSLPRVELSSRARGFRLDIDRDWLEAHPLTLHTLEQERAEWKRLGFELELV